MTPSHGAGALDAEHTHDHDHQDGGDAHDGHDHDHHEGGHDHGPWGWLWEALPFLRGHSHGEATVDDALEGSARGIRALWLSLLLLGATALFQLIIALASGSVGLLADTIHNAGDALTAVPLWIAFVVGRRPANRRYTYGYGRAEDVAGVVIVGVIGASAVVAAIESVGKLLHPQPPRNLGWVMLAAVIGFLGNEAVAQLRMREGRAIGSAALVADGQHARVDGFTSLAVLLGALGVLAGFPLADPLVGLFITFAILVIVRDTAITMWRRLMDAVDPELLASIERAAAVVPGVEDVHGVRVRWLGHQLHAELHVTVDETLPTASSHAIAEDARHHLLHALPKLAVVTVHVDPSGHSGADHHGLAAHHDAIE